MNKTRIIMVLVAIALTVSVASATDWQQFQKNEVKIGRSNASAIVGAGPVVTWSTAAGSFFAAPIAHGGYVYGSNGNGLHKYYYNGTSAPGNWPAGDGAAYGSPAYGNGTGRIFFYGPFIANQQTIKGVNENDPGDIWTVSPPGASGDAWGIFKSGSTYAINKTGTKSIYFGDFGDRFYCYDVGGANFALRWTYVGAGAQFWAGAAVIGDYVVFGNDGGWVTCLNESDGSFVDSININHNEIRSSISWNATNDTYGHIFLTSKGSRLSKVGFNTSTGQFDGATEATITYATTTPVVYNGRVYVSSSGAGVSCFHESNLTKIWDRSVGGAVQASPALAKRDGYVYIYVTRNSNDGGTVCVNDTGLSGTVEWTDTTVGSWSMQGVAIAQNDTGTWIFATSQGGCKLAGHWASNPPPCEPDLNVTAIEHSTIYAGTYNIIKATVKNGGNASATGFNATLKVGTTVVDEISVGDLDAGQSTVVKFVWTPTATGPYTLNVTADSDCIVSEGDESNNSLTKGVSAVTIPATDDLAVIEVNDCDLANGEENTVFAVIENKGADASGFDVTLKVGGTEVDTVFVPMLYFRDSQLVAFNWMPTTTGNKNLNVTIEDGGYMTQNVDVVDPVVVSESVSIQSEIDSAGANDITIIRVESGTYNETVTIPAGKLIRLVATASDVVICNNTGDIVTIEGTCCYVEGFAINSTITPTGYANWPGAGINVTPGARWNVVEDNYIYNSSVGIKLHGGKNLIRCNTVGESAEGRACLNLMSISGDCNAILRNKFDGDTGGDWVAGWILGGTYTVADGTTETDANNNTVRGNNFTMTGVGWDCGDLVFGGDPNLVFDNIINDTDSSKVELGRLNWYNVTKVAVDDPMCGNVVHGPYYGGNYWSGYTGSDSDHDLLGDADTPYRDYDTHPLVRALCGDVNCDGVVNDADVGSLRAHLRFGTPLKSQWAANVNGDPYVNDGDVGSLRAHLRFGTPLDCRECGC